MKILFLSLVIAGLTFSLPTNAADAPPLMLDDLAVPGRFMGDGSMITNRAWTPAVPVHKVLTNSVKVTCPICGKATIVPGKKLIVTGSRVDPSGRGLIQDRSALVHCKCGEWLPAHVEVLVPTPKVEVVKETKSPGLLGTLTWSKNKLRAPSDKP